MKSPFPQATYAQNAEVYRLLANPKRLEILNIIKHRERAVEDILKTVGISKANLSQHLSLLRRAGLVKARREGLRAYYRITDPRLVEPCRILHQLRARHALLTQPTAV